MVLLVGKYSRSPLQVEAEVESSSFNTVGALQKAECGMQLLSGQLWVKSETLHVLFREAVFSSNFGHIVKQDVSGCVYLPEDRNLSPPHHVS